jgi:drug/metabolite transporter (DMT)-like permease
MTSKKFINYLSLFVAMFFWGGSFVLTKHLLADFHPITVIFARLVVSSFLFVIIGLSIYKKDFFISKKHILLFSALAFFEPVVYFLFETYSLQFTDPSIVSVIIATIPLFVAFVAVYFLKESFTKFNFMGVILSVLGIVVMLFPSFSDTSVSLLGVLLAFGAVLSTIGYNYFLKRIPHSYSPLLVITWQNLFGLLVFTPLFLLINSTESISNQWFALSDIKNLMALLLLAVFCSSIAFILYIKGVRFIGVAKANTFTNLIPVITAFISFFLFNEVVTWNKIVGILVVLTGIFLVQVKPKPAHSNIP